MLLLFSTGWILLILAYAAWTDIRTRVIPNTLIVVGFIGLLLLQLLNQEVYWESLLIGILVGFGLWRFNFIGGGDSKLIMLVSTVFAANMLPWLYLSISLCGMAQATWHITFKKKTTLPYAVSIFMGFLIYQCVLIFANGDSYLLVY